MADMTEITCKCGCGRKKLVRTADVKRGWGKFFSKSCKARTQERRTHQHAKYLNRRTSEGYKVINGTAFNEFDEPMYEVG